MRSFRFVARGREDETTSGERAAPEPRGLRQALEAYPVLAHPVVSPLAGGLIHASFLVRDGGAQYVLQRIGRAFSDPVERNIECVTRRLEAYGLPTPRLFASGAGTWSVEVSGSGRWRLMTHVPGVSFEYCESPAQARSAASSLARFHSVLAEMPDALEPLGFPFHDMPRHVQDLRQALERHCARPLHSEVAELAERALAAARVLPVHRDVPSRVIHGDPKFSNLIFAGRVGRQRERAIAWIDLDTIARLPLYVDFGDALRSWCNLRPEDEPRAEIDEPRLRAAIEGYTRALGFRLEAAERSALGLALERMSLELCIRFASDALEERHWSWDPGRFGSAGEHNLARARGQFDLYERARALRGEIERLLRA